MEEERQLCIKICGDFIGKTHSKTIEKCIYDYSNESKYRVCQNSWNTYRF